MVARNFSPQSSLSGGQKTATKFSVSCFGTRARENYGHESEIHLPCRARAFADSPSKVERKERAMGKSGVVEGRRCGARKDDAIYGVLRLPVLYDDLNVCTVNWVA